MIINALGTGFGNEFNINNLKYHKVIILADADQDGAHIRAILLTMSWAKKIHSLIISFIFVMIPEGEWIKAGWPDYNQI